LRRGERCGAGGDEDGGLIGGAALKPEDFMAIINAANQE
jgi:triosephosphate isomerase (TIM)